MTFPCTQCGACCRSIAAVPELQGHDRGDGVCRHLTSDNRCAVYETRPMVCRVNEQCPPAMQLGEWHRRNTAACERLYLQVYGQ